MSLLTAWNNSKAKTSLDYLLSSCLQTLKTHTHTKQQQNDSRLVPLFSSTYVPEITSPSLSYLFAIYFSFMVVRQSLAMSSRLAWNSDCSTAGLHLSAILLSVLWPHDQPCSFSHIVRPSENVDIWQETISGQGGYGKGWRWQGMAIILALQRQ